MHHMLIAMLFLQTVLKKNNIRYTILLWREIYADNQTVIFS